MEDWKPFLYSCWQRYNLAKFVNCCQDIRPSKFSRKMKLNAFCSVKLWNRRWYAENCISLGQCSWIWFHMQFWSLFWVNPFLGWLLLFLRKWWKIHSVVLVWTRHLQVQRLKLIIRCWTETRINFLIDFSQYQEKRLWRFDPLTVVNFRINSSPLEIKSFSLSSSPFSYFSLHLSAIYFFCIFGS